jgi:hypothetical protein
MASSNVFTWVLLGGAAYLAYNYFSTPVVAAAAPAGGSAPPTPATPVTPTAPVTPPVAYVPPSLTQQLQTLAGPGVSTLDADQWNYYYSQPSPTGLGQPAVANFNSIFFPTGRPADNTQNPQMTAAQFVAAIGNPGLSGYQGYKRAIPVPDMWARGMGHFTLGDFRRAGGR